MSSETIVTPLTTMLGVKYPIMLAGMSGASGPKLAAAVTNAGGIGVIGGVGFKPKMLRKKIGLIKKHLNDKNGAFGVDLLLPQVGGSARKTNYDYTKGKLPQLIDVIIEEKAKLFVSAVGIPPQWAVDKLHAAGIAYMNMVGDPKHVKKALAAGADIICAQGGEAGGHTGDIPTSVLLPACVDACKGHNSPLTGKPVSVVGAGGIYEGRGLAMCLSAGAAGVWVGTRFVAATEAGAPSRHKKAIVGAGFDSTVRSMIFTGRPLRLLKNDYIMEWQTTKRNLNKELRDKGEIPVIWDLKQKGKVTPKMIATVTPLFMGQVAGAINDIKPAKEIVDEMITTAIATLKGLHVQIQPAKL